MRLAMDEKLWILNHRKENPKITQNKIENERPKKLCYQMDQMYIEQNFETEAVHEDLIIVRNTTGVDIWGLKFRKNVIKDEKIEIFRRILPGETVIFDGSIAIAYRKDKKLIEIAFHNKFCYI